LYIFNIFGLSSGVVTLDGEYALLQSSIRLSQLFSMTGGALETNQPQHLAFRLAQCTEFIPTKVTLEQKDKDPCENKTMILLEAPLCEVFKSALKNLLGSDEILESLDVFNAMNERIPDVFNITLREYAIQNPLPIGVSEYEFVLRDAQALLLRYKPYKGDDVVEKIYSLKLPPMGITLEDVRKIGCETLGLDPANVFVSTTTGIALLDTSSEVDSYHISEGLCLCDMEDMLRVTVNENFAVGFTRSSKPNADLLLRTMGMPDDVFICFDDVVLPNDTLLVPDGSYNVVELPSEDFRSVTIKIPSFDPTNPSPQFVVLDAFVEATVGSLIRAALDRAGPLFASIDPSVTTILIDKSDCVLDFALPVYMIPADSPDLQLAFV